MNQKQTLAAVEAMLFACGDPIVAVRMARALQRPQTGGVADMGPRPPG